MLLRVCYRVYSKQVRNNAPWRLLSNRSCAVPSLWLMHHEPAQARRALPRRRATPHEGPPPSASPRRVTAACPRVPPCHAVPVPVQAENVREQRKELREEACGWDPKYARIHTHTRTHTYFQTKSREFFVCLFGSSHVFVVHGSALVLRASSASR